MQSNSWVITVKQKNVSVEYNGKILKTNNEKNIPEKVLEFAASLAAFYSKLSNSPKVEIDYTEVKNVKKIPGAKPGMVIYENYKTLCVKPLEIN